MTSDQLWEVWGRTNALYTQWCSAQGANAYQQFVLYALHRHAPTTQKKIADLTGLSKQTVGTVMRGLKQAGLVSLSPGEEDHREKYVRLTEAGLRHAQETLSPLYALENRVFAMIGEARVRQMVDTISLFNAVFEKEMQKQEVLRHGEK